MLLERLEVTASVLKVLSSNLEQSEEGSILIHVSFKNVQILSYIYQFIHKFVNWPVNIQIHSQICKLSSHKCACQKAWGAVYVKINISGSCMIIGD